MQVVLGNVVQKGFCPTVDKQGGIVIKETIFGNEIILDVTITRTFLQRYKENNHILECEEEYKEVLKRELERRI